MDLKDYRQKIDVIDDQLVELFRHRMEVAREIAAYKKEKCLPILDAERERQKIRDLTGKMPPELRSYTGVLYASLFELSRSYQNRQLLRYTELYDRIAQAIADTTPLFPRDATVAICGVEGDLAQIACEKLFPQSLPLYINSFEGVFSAIDSGLSRYGVVPLENSTAGSEKKIHDLMVLRRFSIVRSARLKVDYNLLSKPDTHLEDVKEIFSHQQTISQCARFLKALGPGVKLTVCENTAVAARMVAQSERQDVAAICSRNCMELYDLKCLRDAIQDSGDSYIRFICISKNLEIYPGADRTSIQLALPNKPGALYKLLARFYALGINITKLESRPIPGRDWEVLFHLDLEASIYSLEFVQIICELSASFETFAYLGSYSEVV